VEQLERLELASEFEELARKLAALEKKYDAQFKVVFDAIRELMAPPPPKRRRIGFVVEEKATAYGRRQRPEVRGRRWSLISTFREF
jgi:hypothetical protein